MGASLAKVMAAAMAGVGRVFADGVHVHFDGAEVVETPGVPGDGGGEAEFQGGFGGKVFDEVELELFEDGAEGW